MASRRDQLHSYQFMIQRVVAALVMRETDPAQSPFRRAAGAIFAGFMVATILVAGFAVYGLWNPGGNVRWKTDSDNDGKPVPLVEEETGAAYVYWKDVLYPAENYTSAMLAGNPDGRLRAPLQVSRDSLAGIDDLRIGHRIGIPGAPDSLPSRENLIAGDWTLCSQPGDGGDPRPESLMVVGERPDGYRAFGPESVMLVREADAGAGTYLIYHGHRFPIPHQVERFVLQALSVEDVVPVSGAWLNVLPQGQDIAPLQVAEAGAPSGLGHDITIGELYEVTSAGTVTWYVALKHSLARVTELQAQILETTGVVRKTMDRSLAAQLDQTPELLPSEQKLAAPPESVAGLREQWVEATSSSATCAIFSAKGAGVPEMVHSASMRRFNRAGVRTEMQDANGNKLASRVVVPPGKGAVVWALQDPENQVGGSLCLITDTGMSHTLAKVEVLAQLGYDPDAIGGWMPTYLVERLPRGPSLDPQAAWQQVLAS